MKDMSTNFLEELLADFGTVESVVPANDSAILHVRVPVQVKRRYDRLQELSKRRFSRKVREVVLALIEVAEKKAS